MMLDKTLYTYCKKHPNLLIAVISAIVTILLAFSKYVAYLVNYKRLEYWNINLDEALNSYFDNLWIHILKNVFLCVIMTGAVYLMRGFVVAIINCIEMYRLSNVLNDVNSASSKYYKGYLSDDEIVNNNENINIIAKKTKKNVCKELLQILAMMSLYILCVSALEFPYSGMLENIKRAIIPSAILYAVMIILLLIIESRREEHKKINDTIKSVQGVLSCDNEHKLTMMYSDLIVEYAKLLKKKGMAKVNSEFLKSNLFIVLLCIVMVTSCATQTFVSVNYATDKESRKDSFYITEFDGISYALLYSGQNIHVFGKATICNNDITIDAKEQLVVNELNGLSLKLENFTNVFKDSDSKA